MNYDLERALVNQEQALEKALEKTPEYQQLKIVQRALADVRALNGGGFVKAALTFSPPTIPGLIQSAQVASITEAARLAIEEVGYPVSTKDLLPLLAKYGKTVSGKNPANNLSNNLSSNKKLFKSVPWRGATAWWFPDRAVPA